MSWKCERKMNWISQMKSNIRPTRSFIKNSRVTRHSDLSESQNGVLTGT